MNRLNRFHLAAICAAFIANSAVSGAVTWHKEDIQVGGAVIVHDGRLWSASSMGAAPLSVPSVRSTYQSDRVPWWGLIGFSFMSHDGFLVVAGGTAEGRNEVYASADGIDWFTAGSLPWELWELHDHKAVSIGDVAYIIGGAYLDYYYYGYEDLPAYFLASGVLMARNNDWNGLDGWDFSPWRPRSQTAAVAFRDELWVLGGLGADRLPIEDISQYEWLNDVWRAAITVETEGESARYVSLTWTQVTSQAPWCGRSGHACVVFQDKLWIIGGYNGHRALNDVWVSEDGANWEQVTDQAPWRGRSGHSAVVYQDKLWVLAGANRNTNLIDVWTYDPAAAEGEGEGEGEPTPQRYYHSADEDTDRTVGLSELLRVIQFFNSDGLHCEPCTEDDYNPGAGDIGCRHHDSDYTPEDWHIDLNELLRLIQLYNMGGYHPCEGTEDGFCPGAK